MKLNIDKEKLLKNKFWIILVLAVPMILASQYIVMGPVADEIAKKKKAVMAELKKQVPGPFYNAENIQKKLNEAEAVRKQEYKWWEELYAGQAPYLFWPQKFEETYPMKDGKFLRELKYLDAAGGAVPDDKHHFTGKLVSRDNDYLTVAGKDGKKHKFYRVGKDEMKLERGMNYFDLPLDREVQVTYQTGRYFNDKLSDTEQSNYTRNYGSQIRPILELVEPMNDEGEGVVILKDWLVPKKSAKELPPATSLFLRTVPLPWKSDADISEEAWIAQEDLWIQKEIYRLIRQANDYVGKMEGKGVSGLNSVATFKNVYFELGVKLLKADKLQVTIKNLQNRRKKLEVKFLVKFTDDQGGESVEKISIEGEPLDPVGITDSKGKAKDTLTTTIDLPSGPNRNGIANVEQALSWDSAAVRRIDHIAIGSLAMTEIALNHRSFPEGVKPLIAPPKIETPPAGEGEVRKQRDLFIGGGLDGGPGANPNLLVNGLIKNRYSEEPTEQTRRLPIAVSLIVDQDHVDRVLTSFGNSKFRFVLNQMLMNRYPLSVRPSLAAQEKFGPGNFPLPKPLPFGRPPAAGGADLNALASDEENESNIELVLYGTVTLYQRFPPRDLPKSGPDSKD